MSKMVALLALVIGLGACDGQPLPGEDTAITPGSPSVTPVPVTSDCVAGLTSGQSAVITSDGCSVVAAGGQFTVPPGVTVLSTWLGPHTELCYGPTADEPDACEGSSALAAVQGSSAPPAPGLVVTSVVYDH
jgi:hypothetical protein